MGGRSSRRRWGVSKKAIRAERTYLEQDPLSSIGWTNLGSFLGEDGPVEAAREAYAHSLEISPENASAARGLAEVELLERPAGEGLALVAKMPQQVDRLVFTAIAQHDEKALGTCAPCGGRSEGDVAITASPRLRLVGRDRDAAFEWLDRAYDSRHDLRNDAARPSGDAMSAQHPRRPALTGAAEEDEPSRSTDYLNAIGRGRSRRRGRSRPAVAKAPNRPEHRPRRARFGRRSRAAQPYPGPPKCQPKALEMHVSDAGSSYALCIRGFRTMKGQALLADWGDSTRPPTSSCRSDILDKLAAPRFRRLGQIEDKRGNREASDQVVRALSVRPVGRTGDPELRPQVDEARARLAALQNPSFKASAGRRQVDFSCDVKPTANRPS